jgi:hypothetical protein
MVYRSSEYEDTRFSLRRQAMNKAAEEQRVRLGALRALCELVGMRPNGQTGARLARLISQERWDEMPRPLLRRILRRYPDVRVLLELALPPKDWPPAPTNPGPLAVVLGLPVDLLGWFAPTERWPLPLQRLAMRYLEWASGRTRVRAGPA